jgi:hypothetical protein
MVFARKVFAPGPGTGRKATLRWRPFRSARGRVSVRQSFRLSSTLSGSLFFIPPPLLGGMIARLLRGLAAFSNSTECSAQGRNRPAPYGRPLHRVPSIVSCPSVQTIQEVAIPVEGSQAGHRPADAHKDRDPCLLHNLKELSVKGCLANDAHG